VIDRLIRDLTKLADSNADLWGSERAAVLKAVRLLEDGRKLEVQLAKLIPGVGDHVAIGRGEQDSYVVRCFAGWTGWNSKHFGGMDLRKIINAIVEEKDASNTDLHDDAAPSPLEGSGETLWA